VPGGRIYKAETDGEGIFRVADLPAGNYEIKVARGGFTSSTDKLRVGPGSIFIVKMEIAPLTEAAADSVLSAPADTASPYRELVRQPDEWPAETAEGAVPSAELVFQPRADRWEIPHPEWDRYAFEGEHPWIKGKLSDPYNQNKWKGDFPIFGQQVFLNITGSSDTFLTARRLYVPSGASADEPGSTDFFGSGAQGFLAQTFRLSFDLFRGDTSFRPVDWRVRFTPAFNLNYLHTRERGVVNFDVREGTTRLDSHVGIQEAYVEAKLTDLSPEFDFVSVRAGIQPFNSDFRGLIFVDEQPGVRVFGTLHDSRWEYNAAYFYFLEKDTNSLLNSFEKRHQQVALANLYIQDFIRRGYTTQFSFHYNKDDADFHFDKNNFLVRPQAIGAVQPHDIRTYYLGWAGNGHIGRLNISHAFYQVLGRDELNPIAGREIDVNAQLAALELSIDKDWLRLRGAMLYASGDDDPRDDTGRGFDAILDVPAFAGGVFSFFNRESIRLTGTGVALMPPNSFLPNLRSSKDEGQASYVNPGLLLLHAGADFDLTPKLRSFVNANFMRFDHTEPLELLLFQAPIDNWLGADYSVGFQYRPPLTENMTVTTGVSALTPWAGLRRIYQDKTVFAVFVQMRLLF
jgi:hypothetical protein